MAPMAACLLVNVTKAHPLLCPWASLRTVHSSIEPCPPNSARTSASDIFFDSIPTNSLRSAKENLYISIDFFSINLLDIYNKITILIFLLTIDSHFTDKCLA